MGPEARSTGLRERKKRYTREKLSQVSLQLFLQDGFEAVTVAQIAHAAEVSPATVFNYFATKEDLVFERLDRFWDDFLSAVRERPEGVNVVDAAETFITRQGPPGRSDGDQLWLEGVSKMISASPALLARERASYDHAARRLGGVIAETSPSHRDAGVIADMILCVHRALVAFVRERLIAGAERVDLNAEVADRTRRGFELLRHGVGV